MTMPVKKILETFFAERNTWQLQLLKAWPSIVGSIKTKVHLLKIYEDTLIIGVFDSCWLQELYLLSPLLIETINVHLDKPRIKALRFRALGIAQTKKKKESSIAAITKKPVHLNSKEQAALDGIEDEQLQAVLRDYLIRCHSQR